MSFMARTQAQLPTVAATAVVTAAIIGGLALAQTLLRLGASLRTAHKRLDNYVAEIETLRNKTSFKKPKYIILVRHGESYGNVNEDEYKVTPDSKVELTEKGREQARSSGRELRALLNGMPVWSFCSPYQRAKQTADYCLKELDGGQVLQHREDPRLREQEFKGTFQDEEMEESKRLRALYGSFFFRFPNGESAADVYDRVSVFMDTLWRDFATYDLSDTAVVIFTHGLTARIFLMRWFRWSSDDFQTSRNPRNGAMMVMERIADPFEPGRTTMELRADARELLSIKPELCYTIRDRQITTLELPP
eukprot:m.318196 g.318196  ORF g.318196 m.318196 type:complete len:306 (+) comp16444_c0_seq3:156-1073(+)